MDIFTSIRSRSIKLKSNNQSKSFSRSNTADYGSLVWTFNPHNHYLSTNLTKMVYSKWTVRFAVGSWVLLLLSGIAGAPINVFIGAGVLLTVMFYMPFHILLILSFNRDACGFLMRSSEFWIKIVYSEIQPILGLIYYHQVGRRRGEFRNVPEWLGYTLWILWCIESPLFMAIVGGVDAMPKMKFKWKATLIASVAIVNTFQVLHYHLLVPAEDDYTLEIQAFESVVSFHSLFANVYGMLAMFMWKQMIDVVRNKDRCVSILYRPYLRWEAPGEECDATNVDILRSTPVLLQTAT